MQPNEVHDVLTNIRATHLHHANTVTTSCSFLEQGGLLSRGFVEDRGLDQTPQPSDESDKKYDIWHRIFLDHVDIHDRGGRRKGPNKYGPVLFVHKLDVLLGLPEGSEVLVSKMNPWYWKDHHTDGDKVFGNADELAGSIRYGNFDKMLIIQTPTAKVDFPAGTVQILLDDPNRTLPSGNSAYDHARERLEEAAETGNISVSIEQRQCQHGCICLETYSHFKPDKMEMLFN